LALKNLEAGTTAAKEAAKNAATEVNNLAKSYKEWEDQQEANRKALHEVDDYILQATDKEAYALSQVTEEYWRQVEAISALNEAGLLSDAQAEDRLAGADRALQALAGKTEEVTTDMSEFWKSAYQNIESYMGDSFYQMMKGNYDNIGDAFSDMILRMVAESAAADLAGAIFGGGGKGGGWLDMGLKAIGMMGGTPSAATTANVDADLLSSFPSFDVGTNYVPKTGLAMVHKGEKIIPAAQNNSSSSNSFNFYVQAQPGYRGTAGENRTLQQQGKQLMMGAQRAVARNA
jgi:hypothetical protein